MENLDEYVSGIINGWSSGRYEWGGSEDTDFQEDIDTVINLINDGDVGEEVLRAYLVFWKQNGSASGVDVRHIPRKIEDSYRGYHASVGAFARQTDYDLADAKKQEFLSEYDDFINWEEKAQDIAPDYTFVSLPEDTGVHVFRN